MDNEQDISPNLQDASEPGTEEATLTVDGTNYRMADLPPQGVDLLNDLLRCENEMNEHRFRLRQIGAAQQVLVATLKDVITTSGLEAVESSQ